MQRTTSELSSPLTPWCLVLIFGHLLAAVVSQVDLVPSNGGTTVEALMMVPSAQNNKTSETLVSPSGNTSSNYMERSDNENGVNPNMNADDERGDLEVNIKLRPRSMNDPNDVHLRIMLFATESAWKRGESSRYADGWDAYIEMDKFDDRWNVEEGRAIATFTGLPKARYAAAAHLDTRLPNNGKLNVNFIGYPQEAVGASRNAKGGPFGGPRWSRAVFEWPDSGRIEFDMWYP